MKQSLLTLSLLALPLGWLACDSVKESKAILPAPFPMTAQEPLRNVDLVFVVDTSGSMMEEQALLRQNFPQLMTQLQSITGGLPNLHLGVITPDLGSSPYNIPGCTNAGEGGIFQKGVGNLCNNPAQHSFIIDIEPRGCVIEKVGIGESTTCQTHDCAQANCDHDAFADGNGGFTEPAGLTLSEDEGGCPRCRNYADETLPEVFSCIADVGTSGCGFEQPLEALYQALTSQSPHNVGFLREDAYLAVVFITDEDDCSVENTEIFNPDGDISSPLGPMNSFRCTEFGVVCDADWNRVLSNGPQVYNNCVSRPDGDPKRMLYPLERYTGLLASIKNPSKIIATAVAGLSDGSLAVTADMNQFPQLESVCGSESSYGVPAVRILEFIDSFYPDTPIWAKTSICDSDYSPTLVGLGRRLATVVGTQCLSAVPAGCMDPSFAFGQSASTALPIEVAAICAPDCTVELVDENDVHAAVSACSADYQGGHPAAVDANLPEEACWHLSFSATCAAPCPAGSTEHGCDPVSNPWNYPSRGAQLVVSRRAAPTEGVRIAATCSSYALTEAACSDGLDNDADGRVDGEDPDCASN